MWGGGGNAATQGALTRAEMEDGFNTQSLLRGQESTQHGISDLGYAELNRSYQNQIATMQEFNRTTQQLMENRFASEQCCCRTNSNIDSVKFENAQNTCKIENAIHAEGEATRALINANTMQALRDKLADKDRDILARDMQLSQLSQTQNLISELRPCAKPTYITCSPYQAAPYPYNGYNNSCGNSCGSQCA